MHPFHYILHLRPRSWPVVAGHMLVGFLVVPHIDWSYDLALKCLFALVCWVPLLNGGTLAINSYYDNDEGDIGYLNDPPPIPRYLQWFSLFLLVAGLPLSWIVSRQFFWAYAASVVLSILYSVPPLRLKSKPGIDALINGIGYGALTFFAGYAVHGVPASLTIVAACLFYFFLFIAFYPLTQIYQYEEDVAKGDVTLTIFFGKRNVLFFSVVLILIAYGCLALSFLERPITGGCLAVALSALLWLGLLGHWLAAFDRYPHKNGMYRALYIWAFTDIAVVIAFSGLIDMLGA